MRISANGKSTISPYCGSDIDDDERVKGYDEIAAIAISCNQDIADSYLSVPGCRKDSLVAFS